MTGKQITNTDIQLGNNIHNRRIELGISRKELANQLGISHQQVNKYEKGQNRVSVSMLINIANILLIHYSLLINPNYEDDVSRDLHEAWMMRKYSTLSEMQKQSLNKFLEVMND